MPKKAVQTTIFGQDLDILLQAAKFTLREYAEKSGVNYKYLSQLRTIPSRRPGNLYVDLLAPFAQLGLLNLLDSHKLSIRHRGKPLSHEESRELFSELSQQEIDGYYKRVIGSQLTEDSEFLIINPQDSPERGVTFQPSQAASFLRKVFVGRQSEMNELRSAFEAVSSGDGALIMIGGEPGIGKTTLTKQLENYVRQRGCKSLVGHCYEKGSFSIPYLAFVEALRTYVLVCNPEELKGQLGTTPGEIATIIPEVASKIQINQKSKGKTERLQLFRSVVDFIGNIAASDPLLMVFEDLHDADLGTLDLLDYTARNLSGKKALIVGTYRDAEVNRNHPLSTILAEMRRQPNFGRIHLKGLDKDETSRMLSIILGLDAPLNLIEAVFRHTEGNPLFIEEVSHHLVKQGVISSKDGTAQIVYNGLLDIRIPDGLREVIGKRVSSLSESCISLLSVAAVIGRQFNLDLLRKVTQVSEEKLVDILEEARKVAIIDESIENVHDYRFTHALIRQTLYEEIVVPRRLRLHQQVAWALEETYRNQLEDHAVELVEHFSRSPDIDDRKKAITYLDIAVDRAKDVFAHREVVRLLEQSLKMKKELDPDDKERQIDILMELTDALIGVSEATRALNSELPQALDIAESIGNMDKAAQVCLRALRTITYSGPVLRTDVIRWLKKLNLYAQPGTIEKARADIYNYNQQPDLNIPVPYTENAVERYRKLVQQAKHFGDGDLMMDVHALIHETCVLPAEEILQFTEEYLAGPPGSGYRQKCQASVVFLRYANRTRYEELRNEAKLQAELTSHVNELAWEMGEQIGHLANIGNLEQAVEMTDRLISFGNEVNIPEYVWLISVRKGLRPRIYLGGSQILVENTLSQLLIKKPIIDLNRAVPLIMAWLGKHNEVVQLLDNMLESRSNISTHDDITRLHADVNYLEAAVLVKHFRAVEALLNRLVSLNTSGQITNRLSTCVDRHLGNGMTILGKYSEAIDYYNQAIDTCMGMGFRTEVALSRFQLAELLLNQYPKRKKEALKLLNSSIKEFREMKMQPSLERALRRKEILKA